jgi:hypothetical protein
MKPAKLSLIPGVLIALSFTTVHSATVTLPPKTGSQPSTAAPPAKTQAVPKVPTPGLTPPRNAGMAPGPGIIGPTDNITKVANAIQVKAKSLTTLVVVAPGQAITQPVTIAITLGGYCPTVITQSYVVSTGNHFLYNDCEQDGKPRRGRMDITLTENNPAGGVYTFALPPGNVNLDPLYDVSITPLAFKLIDDCDTFGDSEVRLWWTTVDGQYYVFPVNMHAGQSVNVSTNFAWNHAEVSASANLHMPKVGFFELDAFENTDPYYKEPPSPINLVPGKTQTFNTTSKASGQDCRGSFLYTIRYTLRWYPYL